MNGRFTFALFLSAFAFLSTFSLSAQSSAYFPGTIIVKYKSGSQIADLKAKLGIDPENQVQQMLASAGMSESKPFWEGSKSNRNKNKTVAEEKAEEELSRIYEISYTSQTDPALLAAKLSRMPAVEYAEPKYIRYMQYSPDDPISNPQKEYHNFEEAWDVSMGSSDVIIAIVDGGVGYLHPELKNKLWINEDEIPAGVQSLVNQNSDEHITGNEVEQYLQDNDEDNNGDGTINLQDALHPNSSLTTNSDVDGNGFNDDLFGWDFWEGGSGSGSITTDNDPIHNGTDHGTHVAGIAAAETDNDTGIYGTGFSSRYMAVKAGGIPDDPGTPNVDESRAIAFGFEGIIYTAEEGAHIINCSWGGGSFSQAENDVIQFALSRGALVVAAAGNEGRDGITFPAAYQNVFAVGSVDTDDSRATYSNFGYELDVLATGSNIQSTVFNNAIGTKTGTSMSTPVVSGLAALIKDIHPSWTPQRVRTQIRTTATSVDAGNASLPPHKLGKGKVNAFEALSSNNPGIVIESVTFENTAGEKLGLGEQGQIRLVVTNHGASTSNLSLALSNLDNQNITLSETSKQLGSMATGTSTVVTFNITIDQNFNLNTVPVFRLNFSDSNSDYTDFDILEYEDLLYDIVAENRVKTSFAGDGTVGFTDPFDGNGGIGFIPREQSGSEFTDGDNLLFEGGVMIEIDGNMYDAVRSTNGQLSRDFTPTQVFKTTTSGGNSDQDGFAAFSIGDSGEVQQIDIDLETYAYDDPPLSNLVYLKYTLKNPSSFVLLKNIYVGLFNDWDIGRNSSNNGVAFSAQDSVLYIFDEKSESAQPVVAVAQLGNISSLLAIDNALEGRQDSITFGLYDGFTDAEKSSSLKAGTVNTSALSTDVSTVVASGPYDLGPNARLTIGFVYAFGADESTLHAQISEARQQAPFETSQTGLAVSDDVPTTTRLFPNYPNPFSPTTQLRIDLEEPQNVKLTIYDVLGRRVRVLVNQQLEARTHIITFNAGDLSSGVYFARLKTENGIQTIPMTLIK